MFGSCPCSRAHEGVFLGTWVIFGAVWCPAVVGMHLGAMIAMFLSSPLNPPWPLVILALVLATGITLIVVGVRSHLRDGDGAPIAVSVVMVAGCSAGLFYGWYLGLTGLGLLIVKGCYVSFLASGCSSLLMEASAAVWRAGFIAADSGGSSPEIRRQQRLFEDQMRLLEDMNREHDNLLARLAEQGEILCLPGVRRAALKALHTDGLNLTPDLFRNRTDAFQRAEAVFEKLGVR